MDDLENALWDAVKAVTQLPDDHILYDRTNAPEPNATHIVIRPVHLNPVGGVSRSTLLQTDGTQRSTLNHEYYVQFTTVGDNAGNLAAEFMSAFDNEYTCEEFTKRKISFLRKTYARRVPKLREDEWVSAYNFECFFIVNIETKTNTPAIDYIKYTSTYKPDNISNTTWLPSTPL